MSGTGLQEFWMPAVSSLRGTWLWLDCSHQVSHGCAGAQFQMSRGRKVGDLLASRRVFWGPSIHWSSEQLPLTCVSNPNPSTMTIQSTKLWKSSKDQSSGARELFYVKLMIFSQPYWSSQLTDTVKRFHVEKLKKSWNPIWKVQDQLGLVHRTTTAQRERRKIDIHSWSCWSNEAGSY